MNTVYSQTSPLSLLSEQEIAKATEYLNATRDSLLHCVSDLSDAQWHYSPGSGGWSIAEILEHIVIVEGRVHGIIGRMPDAPVSEPSQTDIQVEEIILSQVPNRSTKVKAPPESHPSHRWTPAQTLTHFVEGRDRTIRLLTQASHLRGHIVPHPVLGPWDGYQWILAAGAHGARHTDQMYEVKANPGFAETYLASAT